MAGQDAFGALCISNGQAALSLFPSSMILLQRGSGQARPKKNSSDWIGAEAKWPHVIHGFGPFLFNTVEVEMPFGHPSSVTPAGFAPGVCPFWNKSFSICHSSLMTKHFHVSPCSLLF